jgi:hypothetical protein
MLTAAVGVIGALCFIFGAKAYAADADKVKHETVIAA